MRRTILLIDATGLGHRAFHSPGRRGSVAEAFGFSLNRWCRSVRPDLALAVFDGDGPCWRRELWPAYKSGRDSSSRPTASDWAAMHDECESAGVRWASSPATEADDLIASYTAAAIRLELDVVILSNDKDMLQLVRTDLRTVPNSLPNVFVRRDVTGKIIGSDEVLAAWGVWPHALPDLLALAGDSSDGYPGVCGIGPKMAARLINEHGDVKQIIEHVNVLPRKVHEQIVAQLDELRIFRRLAGLIDDLPLPVGPDELTRPRAVR